MRIVLSVIRGPHTGKEFHFSGHDNFIVGRAPEATFRLPFKDRNLSRHHFMVEVNPPYCRLMDMNSRNGTLVNDQKVQTADLRDGDQIECGKTIFGVSIENAPAVETVPLPDAAAPAARYGTLGVRRESDSQDPIRMLEKSAICPGCCGPIDGRSIEPLAGLCLVCADAARSRSQPIAGFWLIRKLGEGGMGIVELALREADGSIIAVKMIRPRVRPTEIALEKFLREADILRELEHPNIVRFEATGAGADDLLYFAMEFVRGIDASTWIARQPDPTPIAPAVKLVCQLLDALDYAHAKGMVHRDIKPANLLISQQPGGDQAKLADFGLARNYQASSMSGLTMLGDVGGTIAYMPPEQITRFREAKPSADLYSTAATLYHLLTGRIIFDLPSSIEQQLLTILQRDPVPILSRRPDLPAPLADAIHRSLRSKPEDRHPNAQAMRQALLPFCRL